MAKMTTGIDPGLRTTKVVRGQYKGNTFHMSDFAIHENAVDAPEKAWGGMALDFKPGVATVGITGRDVNIRYTRVPRVPDWQLRNLMRFEVAEIGDQSGSEVASDFNLLPELPEIEGEDVVLLAMAREEMLSTHVDGVGGIGGKVDAFMPNALGLYNAWVRYGVLEGETVLLANIGYDNIDVCIVRGPDLVFARNLSGGSRLFDDAIGQVFSIGGKKAEEVKIEMATLRPGASYADANQERASRAILGAAGQILSLLQSTLLFSKSQLKIQGLKLDRVMLCGGGAALDGLPEYLSAGMNMPVQLFDPFRVVDVSGLCPEAAAELEEYKLESVVALGLATAASDPEGYSVEILPAAMRKKREFMNGPAWLIAAGVLALGYLGVNAWKTSQELGVKEELATKLSREAKRKSATDKKAQELASKNAELSELGMLLQGTAGSGEQLARLIHLMDEDMPSDFWIRKLEGSWSFDEQLRIERATPRPVIKIDGSAKEGVIALPSLYEGFLSALRDKLPEVELQNSKSSNGTKFEIRMSTLSPPEPEVEPEIDDEEEAE